MTEIRTSTRKLKVTCVLDPAPIAALRIAELTAPRTVLTVEVGGRRLKADLNIKSLRKVCVTLAVAAGLFLATSPAWSECDTSDAHDAQIQLQIDETSQRRDAYLYHRRPTDADVNEIYIRFDKAVSAAVARCRRGDLISIPTQYIKRFCDFSKNIVRNGDMTTCVKR
jgi:hypothetical protein